MVGVGGLGVGVGVTRMGVRDHEKKLVNKMAITIAIAVEKTVLRARFKRPPENLRPKLGSKIASICNGYKFDD